MPIRELTGREFPSSLQEIPQPPKKLWTIGALPGPSMKTLAVVGSRTLSSYGKEACRALIAGLAGYPISIISGLALGTDACAHEAALSAGLHTVAIPGSGLGEAALYPRANVPLARHIVEAGGCLLSEHPAEYRAQKFDFPSRNRIMAGMADAVLIVEAGEKSGTLITARLAADYNRELLCIPHRIGDAHGFGNHLFIRLGATLVSESTHILEALRLPTDGIPEQKTLPVLSGIEKELFTVLEEPKTSDELIRMVSPAPSGAIQTALASLELEGFIEERSGTWRRI